MEFCFLAIASLALVDGREITVGIYHVGLETERGFKRHARARVLTGTRQRAPEIEVRQREAVQQTHGAERAVRSSLVVAKLTING